MLASETILQGRYRIVRQLGQGGMGAVYEAVDQRLDKAVALKETLFADERLRKQFEREARLLARLHHPALPRVSDHFSEGDGQFLIMQFIPGDDLSEMMTRKRGPFPPDQVLTWADQLLDALDYLHTQDPQIVHRDIKPQNLKLTARGQIILLDFGLAKGQGGEVSRVTASASIFGYTPNYAPLEQIQGLGTDSRSDLYALGATVYHLMTGVKPPDALTRAAALVNGQPDPLVPASEANVAVAPEVDSILEKALAQNREQRYLTASDMAKALHGTDQAATVVNRAEAQTVLLPSPARTISPATLAVAKQPTVSAGETTVVRDADFGSKRRVLPWILSVAAAAALAVGMLGFYVMRQRSVRVVQLSSPEAPAQAESPATKAPTASGVENANSAREERKKSANAPTPAPKKTEKPARTENARKAAPDRAEPPSERVIVGHEDRPPGVPAVPQDLPPEGQNRGRRNLPTTRVMPGGVVIRNFPDGSQIITTPDGTRVFVGPDGKRQVLQPGQKVNRRKMPPPSP